MFEKLLIIVGAVWFSNSDFNSFRNEILDFVTTALVTICTSYYILRPKKLTHLFSLLTLSIALFIIVHNHHIESVFSLNLYPYLMMVVFIILLGVLIYKLSLFRKNNKLNSELDKYPIFKIYKSLSTIVTDSEQLRFIAYEAEVWRVFVKHGWKFMLKTPTVGFACSVAFVVNILLTLWLISYSQSLATLIFILNLYPIIWWSSVSYCDSKARLLIYNNRLLLLNPLRAIAFIKLYDICSVEHDQKRKVLRVNLFEKKKVISFFGSVIKTNSLVVKIVDEEIIYKSNLEDKFQRLKSLPPH